MAKLTKYTTTEKVRNALGVTDNEFPDDMLTGQELDTYLLVDLSQWYPSYETVWSEYKSATPSAEQTLKGRLMELYAMWFCAVRAAEMWLAMPQRISDGKADMRRFSELDLEQLLKNAQAKANKFKGELLDIEDPNRTKGYGAVGIASPAYDPVTGEGT